MAVRLANVGASGGLVSSEAAVALAANFTTTSIVPVDTALKFAALANTTYIVRVKTTIQVTGAVGFDCGLRGPAGSSLEGWFVGSGVSLTTIIRVRQTVMGTLVNCQVDSLPGEAEFWARVVVGATPGDVVFQVDSNDGAQTVTVFAGSTLEAIAATAV